MIVKRWITIGKRSYMKKSDLFDAFVFGADCPSCLWAWSVYWNGGYSAWVENSFLKAKEKADECIRNVELQVRKIS